ncbi:hypothetical protein ACTGXY_10535 [Streptococcus suis]
MIKNIFLEKISDYKIEIIEHSKDQKFEMCLKIFFPEKGRIFKLGQHNPDDLGMNTLIWSRCPDGIVLRIDEKDGLIDIFIFELKKTAISHLNKIPSQFHAGVLRALSDISIIHSPFDFSNDEFLINFRIKYHFFIGTTATFCVEQPKGVIRTIPGTPSPENPLFKNYMNGIVKMSCKEVGNQDIVFKFQELIFKSEGIDSNGFDIYNYDFYINS